MSTKKRGLGRGLDVLLSSVANTVDEEAGDQLRELPVEALQPGRHQPRRQFDAAALEALTESVRAQGIVQPIVVRAVGGDRYEIVAGERRWRAAKQAGLKTVPAVVKTLDEQGAMAVALVENIQRADLNPLEEAEALHKLIRDCGLTHEAAATAVGRSRTHITNLLRLIELNEDVQQLVRNGHLSFGHAKVLLGVDGARQSSLAKLAVEKQMSVRQVEALVHADDAAKPRPAKARVPAVEQELAQKIGLPVRLQQNDAGRGRLTVSFKNADELQRLLARLG
ncbi:ParB/RepB/Spo0J family partition protein [Solimonas flava]|uniref:ParB/RepB/Spo0J family partition protein n=1 Tax=Solimonas flava TaxID=415849 RepID=UPI0004812B83|nr:ParB/RepB/Spo0J family partition protein [Solimonas flava]